MMNVSGGAASTHTNLPTSSMPAAEVVVTVEENAQVISAAMMNSEWMANAVGGDPLYFGRSGVHPCIPACDSAARATRRIFPEEKKKRKKTRRRQDSSTLVIVDSTTQESVDASTALIQTELRVRYLCPEDIEEVKLLCNQIFPIEYPDYWFQDVVSNQNLFSLAATYQGRIIGLLVAEVKRLNQCNTEDRDLLSKSFPANTPVTYLLSLGVIRPYRRHKVASYLLDQLIAYLTNGLGTPLGVVKAVYLHVLATNSEAMAFYRKLHFRQHRHLSGYYAISGELRDGYSFVRYLNGGVPPIGLRDYVAVVVDCIRKPVCAIPKFICRWFRQFLRNCFIDSRQNLDNFH